MINEKENTKPKYCFLNKHGKHEKVEVGVLFGFLLTPDLLSVVERVCQVTGEHVGRVTGESVGRVTG